MSDKILLRPLEAAEMLSIGRTRMYELLARGEIPSIRLGRSVRIPAALLKQWVEVRENSKKQSNL